MLRVRGGSLAIVSVDLLVLGVVFDGLGRFLDGVVGVVVEVVPGAVAAGAVEVAGDLDPAAVAAEGQLALASPLQNQRRGIGQLDGEFLRAVRLVPFQVAFVPVHEGAHEDLDFHGAFSHGLGFPNECFEGVSRRLLQGVIPIRLDLERDEGSRDEQVTQEVETSAGVVVRFNRNQLPTTLHALGQGLGGLGVLLGLKEFAVREDLVWFLARLRILDSGEPERQEAQQGTQDVQASSVGVLHLSRGAVAAPVGLILACFGFESPYRGLANHRQAFPVQE